jgi:4-amino-4-deoxy-L-arabinose transferase-like glycosyltransferase
MDSAVTKVEKYFWHIVVVIIALKLVMAYYVPIISDEAYFYVWGQHWDLNYYDHPPMTGWLMALLSHLGQHIFFSRLLSVFGGLVVAWGIYRLVRDGFHLPDKAKLVCLTFLVSPLHVLFVIVTTDTPVCLFVFLSGMTFFYGRRKSNNWLMVLCGAFWGMAAISKYFALLLMIAYGMVLLWPKGSRGTNIKYFLLIVAGSLPFLLIHLYGSYTNCWTNYMFNVINRNRGLPWKLSTFLTFLGFQVYLATPWALYYLIKHLKRVAAGLREQADVFAWLFLIPLTIFGLIAFHDTGLHWTIAFYPFFALMLIPLSRLALNRIVVLSAILTLVHVIPVLVFLSLPVELFKNFPNYHDYVLGRYGNELYEKMRLKYGSDPVLATNGYYTSAVLTYFSGEHVIIFLDDSKHGRYDDKLTDFRQLEGRDIIILSTLSIRDDYTPHFDSVTYEKIRVKENDFNIIVGRHFHYAPYHDLYLKHIREKYYAIPDFLPVGDCYFFDMYFDQQ